MDRGFFSRQLLVISFCLRNQKNEGRGLLFTNFLCCRQWAGISGGGDQKTSTSWQSQPVTPRGDKSTNGERRIEIHDGKSAKCKCEEKNGKIWTVENHRRSSSSCVRRRTCIPEWGRVSETAPNPSPPGIQVDNLGYQKSNARFYVYPRLYIIPGCYINSNSTWIQAFEDFTGSCVRRSDRRKTQFKPKKLNY